MHYQYKTSGTCSVYIDFDIDKEHTVTNVEFTGGCNGNLKAISRLVDGMSAEQIEKTLSGNTCREKPTSCADQLAKAVHAAASSV